MSSERRPHSRSRHKTVNPADRARSLPHRAPFVWAMFWAALHYLCLLACVTGGVMFLIDGNKTTSWFFIGSLAVTVMTGILAYHQRACARCPLCKGTPLLNSGALPHGRAVRLPPLNYGVSATLRLLCTQEFRCMYCGNLYDLLKPAAEARKRAVGPAREPY